MTDVKAAHPRVAHDGAVEKAAFDAELVARYDVAGPRYTSYPAAPQFRADFGEAELRAAARASNEDPIPRPLSLYVHVPFCFSPCFYCGCTRIITRDRSRAGVYLQRLYREIELVAPLVDRDRPVIQVHFGGGTPNFLDAAQMGELLESLGRHFAFSHDPAREFGIELDPRYADADYVRALAPLGFNRLSVGIQDFDPAVQAAVNRIQSVQQTGTVLDAARASGFRSVSVDLIYGLPKQTTAGFARTLEQVVALAPDRVACYAYAHLPERFRAQRQIVAVRIRERAIAWSVVVVDVAEIDRINIFHATMTGMARALAALAPAPALALIDGNHLPPGLSCSARAIVDGDATERAISAASILAKVARDRLMCELDAQYPGYGFARHKGYSTPEHFAALHALGPCALHRRSFAPVRECSQASLFDDVALSR